jgi:hypothetical protein
VIGPDGLLLRILLIVLVTLALRVVWWQWRHDPTFGREELHDAIQRRVQPEARRYACAERSCDARLDGAEVVRQGGLCGRHLALRRMAGRRAS